MALIKEFTDSSGNHCVQSYWRSNRIYINSDTKSIDLAFYGYRDVQAFAEGLQPLPGAVKTYSVTGQDFLQVAMSAPVGASIYDVLAHASESHALNHPDGFFQGAGQA